MKNNKYKNMNCEAIMNTIKKTKRKVNNRLAGAICFLLIAALPSFAQTRTLGLDEAVQLGIQNSKQLKRSQYKIDEALARLGQAKDSRLPSAKVSFQYLHALMMSLISLKDTDWIGIPVFFASVYAISGFFSKSNSSHFKSAVFDGLP